MNKNILSHVIVLRHGEAQNNIQERYNSNPELPGYFIAHLTDLGKQQVREMGKKLLDEGFSPATITKVYVSPLPRAVQTAQMLVQYGVIKDFTIDSRLIEVNMGDREGHRYDEFPEDSWDHTHAVEYHGELDSDVGKRVDALLIEARRRYPTGTLLFITHGTPALMLIERCTHKKIKLNPAEYVLLDC